MRLALLETYTAVLDTGTTQGAARLLGISQSGISRRISQLEDELGVLLFIRDKSRLIPTRECALLEGEIRGLASRGANLVSTADALRKGNSGVGRLRIAFPASLTLSIVPSIVATFLAEHDRVQIELHTGSYDTIERMLKDGRAELGFVRLPVERSGLEVTPLMRVRTVCVMPSDHPLADRQEVGIKDLVDLPLILLGRTRAPRREIDEAFWNAGVTPRVRVEAHSVLSACGMVAAGLGVTLVNELMAKDYAHLPITIRPVAAPMDHAFAFAVSNDTPPTRTALNFIESATRQLILIGAEIDNPV
jgi:DNA-binding transcriptional LysR family regulator